LPLLQIIVLQDGLKRLRNFAVDSIVQQTALVLRNRRPFHFWRFRVERRRLTIGMALVSLDGAGVRLLAQLLLFLLLDEGVEPVESVDELSREAQVTALQFLEVLLVLGKLATNTQRLKRHFLRD